MKILLALLLAACTSLAAAQTTQTWVKIADENTVGAVTLAAGTTYRFGAATGVTYAGTDCSKANCWAVFSNLPSATTIKSVAWPSGGYPFADPAPGVLKELDILQTTAVQTYSVNGTSKTIAAGKSTTTIYQITATCTGTLDNTTGILTVAPCTFKAVKQ